MAVEIPMKKAKAIIPIIFFALLLLAGSVLHDDYGGFTDEIIEINTAAVNAKYILKKFPALFPDGEHIIPAIGTLEQVPDLLTYEDRVYGTAVMMPTILAALIPGVHFDTASFLNFRRFYTFLQFFLALIGFYLLLQVRFRSTWTAMAGTLMLTLTPRFFAESFYNCKDIVFFSWFLISLSGIGIYLIRKTGWGLALFALGFALAANTRMVGFVLLPAFLFACAFVFWKDCDERRRQFPRIIVTALAALVLFYAVTPYLWESPVKNFIEGIHFSSAELSEREIELLSETGISALGQAELFMDKLVSPKEIWYYLPVWMGITIPVLYLILFFIEIGWIAASAVRSSRHAGSANFPAVFFDTFCFLLLTGGMGGMILMKVNLYHGWRHAYFLYAPLIYLAACGFGNLLALPCKKAGMFRVKNGILTGILLISFTGTGLWMVRNHPLDFVYFNEIGRHSGRQFARDYWGVASKRCLLDLLNEYDGKRIRIGLNEDLTWGSTEFSLMRLPPEQQQKFDPIWQTENAEYLCFSYKNTPGNGHLIPDFEILKTYQVDGFDVGAIYRRTQNFKYQ